MKTFLTALFLFWGMAGWAQGESGSNGPPRRQTPEEQASKTTDSESATAAETEPDKEPWGYENTGSSRKDWNFPLTYTEEPCNGPAALDTVKKFFDDLPAIGYTAPTLKRESRRDASSINRFLAQNIEYPSKPREAGISGRVVISFRITEKGEVQNIAVRTGANMYLDKEAMRVVRKMKFATPPLLNEKPVSICATLPIRFTLK